MTAKVKLKNLLNVMQRIQASSAERGAVREGGGQVGGGEGGGLTGCRHGCDTYCR